MQARLATSDELHAYPFLTTGVALDPHQPPWAEEAGTGTGGPPTPPKDARRAVAFYREAAAQGHAEARRSHALVVCVCVRACKEIDWQPA